MVCSVSLAPTDRALNLPPYARQRRDLFFGSPSSDRCGASSLSSCRPSAERSGHQIHPARAAHSLCRGHFPWLSVGCQVRVPLWLSCGCSHSSNRAVLRVACHFGDAAHALCSVPNRYIQTAPPARLYSQEPPSVAVVGAGRVCTSRSVICVLPASDRSGVCPFGCEVPHPHCPVVLRCSFDRTAHPPSCERPSMAAVGCCPCVPVPSAVLCVAGCCPMLCWWGHRGSFSDC